MEVKRSKYCYGIVEEGGEAASAEVFIRLNTALSSKHGENTPGILFEPHSLGGSGNPGLAGDSQAARKIRVFDAIRRFETRDVDAVLLPSFSSHVFLEEVAAETKLPILNLMEALRGHLLRHCPGRQKLGILTTDLVRENRLFERYFPQENWELLYPSREAQRDCVMPVVQGPGVALIGSPRGNAVDRLARACQDLLQEGAEVIVPGSMEISLAVGDLRERGIPIVDSMQAFVDHAVLEPLEPKRKPFKIGVVGGVGPAATVDFVDKIVRNTPAERDQDHFKLVVEMNPQIPDRTAHLLGKGADPTIALYSTCKKLEADDADIIAIPCNTAHAFVERIQPFLSIPIVNMLVETVECIRKNHADLKVIGLLATSGTIRSKVYHNVILPAGFELLVPDEENQSRVMNSIYGPKGVKAGFTEGECLQELLEALASLVQRGAEVIILGCTELPLLLTENEAFPVEGRTVAVVDPTQILARKCVSLGLQAREKQPG